MMEKIIAVILAMALCVGGTVLAEGEKPAAADYVGEWVDLNGIRHIDIQAREAGDGYIVHVRMDTFSMEEGKYGYILWAYGCVYDEESRTLKSVSRVTGGNGEEADGPEEITDVDSDFTGAAFFFDEEGNLVWSDETEGLDDGMIFIPCEGEPGGDSDEEERPISYAAADEALANGWAD